MSLIAKKISTARRVVQSQGLRGVQAVVKQKMVAKPWVQYASLAPYAVPTIARRGLPNTFIYFRGGIGDDLLLTILFRELRLRKRGKVWAMSVYPDIYINNSDVDLIVPHHERYGPFMKHLGVKVVTPWYSNFNPAFDRDDPFPEQHIISIMCQKAGIVGPITLKPYIALSESELQRGKLVRRQVAIQTAGMTARHAMMNKNWFAERYQEVVSTLSSKYDFVQLGSPSDPQLVGALDLRGKTSIRESAAILANSHRVRRPGWLPHAPGARGRVPFGHAVRRPRAPESVGLYVQRQSVPRGRLFAVLAAQQLPVRPRVHAQDQLRRRDRSARSAGRALRHPARSRHRLHHAGADWTGRIARYRDAVATHDRAWAMLEDRPYIPRILSA